MSRLARPDNRIFFGIGGSGKSWLCRYQARGARRVLEVMPSDAEKPTHPATRDRAELIRRMMAPAFKVTYVVDGQLEEFEWANEAALKARDVLVIWEEASLLTPARLKTAAPHAFQLWMAGRHFGNRVFACSQRPASCSADLRANLSRAAIFRTIEPNDLEFYQRMVGRELLDTIRNLDMKHHECLDWTPNGHKVRRSPFD